MDVEQRLSHFIATSLMHNQDAETLGSEEPLLGSGVLDSLGIMRLVAFAEEEFEVVVSDANQIPEHFQTLHCLAAFIERQQRAQR